MASNHTTNFELCQWQADDQVKRTDFNEDNAKIDAALSALGKAERSQTVTLGPYENGFEFDLSDIDWSRTQFIAIFADIPHDNSDQTPPFVCVVNNSQVASHSTASTNHFALFYPCPILLLLMPFRCPERPVEGIYLGNPSGVGFGSCTFRELKKVNFNGSHPYPDGTTATLWVIS